MKPRDLKLYNKTKKKIYKKYPKHSAYRSGILVKTYKKTYKNKYGKNSKPYVGTKKRKVGLSRWFKEKWVNQRGEVGYKYKSDIYRPSKRITKKTPITHKELSKKAKVISDLTRDIYRPSKRITKRTPKTHKELSKKKINRARTEKYKKGRVKRF